MTLVALVELGRGVLAPDTAVLHADDEGVLRGRSVFETLRAYGGKPFRLDAHLGRLAASAERLRLEPPPPDAFAAAVSDAIVAAALPDATVRLLWTAGREGGGPPAGLVLVSTLPPGHEELRERGLRLAVVEWAAGALAGAKSTSYAENIAAQNQAADRGADDALLVAPDGTVLEAPTSNVWFREGDRLLTPSLSLPILAGVTRATSPLLPVEDHEHAQLFVGAEPVNRPGRHEDGVPLPQVHRLALDVELPGSLEHHVDLVVVVRLLPVRLRCDEHVDAEL